MRLSRKTSALVDKLEALLQNEHTCGCDQSTCDVSQSYNFGYVLWALYLFDSSGAASDEFTALYAQLPRSFYAAARREADEFCDSVEHFECRYCNAVIWDPQWSEGHCESCGGVTKDWEERLEPKERRKGVQAK